MTGAPRRRALTTMASLKPSGTLTAGYATEERYLNLPNLLTVARILLIPVVVLVFWSPTPARSLAAAGVFLVAALTDLLDGYLARRRSQITRLGRLLDPIADKLLVLSGLILLVQFGRVAAWVAIVIIAREVAVTGIRMLAASDGVILSAEAAGKYKMSAQVIAILLLILGDSVLPWGVSLQVVGTAILYLALGLGLWSGWQYRVNYWRQGSSRS